MPYRKIFILLLSLLIILLSISACTPKQNNPDLDSHLWGLIEADKRGLADAFARQRNIELVDDKVTVIIECEPGQVEAAAESATKASAIVELTTRTGLIQAFVPITSLNRLTKEPGIKYIRLPVYAESE